MTLVSRFGFTTERLKPRVDQVGHRAGWSAEDSDGSSHRRRQHSDELAEKLFSRHNLTGEPVHAGLQAFDHLFVHDVVIGVDTLTRIVVPADMSRRKTSGTPLVSPGTRFVALEAKATT